MTEITRTQRFFLVIHLCIGLSLLFWYASIPFLDQLYQARTSMRLLQTVTGEEAFQEELRAKGETSDLPLLKRNHMRFNRLPQEIQTELLSKREIVSQQLATPLAKKIEQSFSVLFIQPPLFLRLWLFFSLLIPMMILFGVNESRPLIWLLPVSTFLYAFFNLAAPPPTPDPFYPNEATLVKDYLHEPLSPHLSDQKEQLQRAWKSYLVDQWLEEPIAHEKQIVEAQVEEALFLFNLSQTQQIPPRQQRRFHQKQPLTSVSFYLFWNLSVAFCMHFPLRRKVPKRFFYVNS